MASRWLRAVVASIAAVIIALSLAEHAVFRFGTRCFEALPASPAARHGAGAIAGPEQIALVLSDMHVLGHRRRTWLDRWWTDRQLRASVDAAQRRLAPDVVVGLGDHLDEGNAASWPGSGAGAWEAYVGRLRGALAGSDVPAVLGTVGNHDAESGARMTDALLARFERAFGSSNAVAGGAGLEFVMVNAMALDACARGPSTENQRTCAETQGFLDAMPRRPKQGGKPRVLLLHVPLFRRDDSQCGPVRAREGGHVTYVAPHVPLKPGEDVLSAAVSQRLLEAVDPDLVLSGHTHAHCVRVHVVHGAREVPEVTLPSFSWRMRPDPSFGFLVHAPGSAGSLRVHVCALPHETWTIAFYAMAGMAAAGAAASAMLRSAAQGARDKKS